jgi:Zn-dependent peptidase ImmA (M78 family)
MTLTIDRMEIDDVGGDPVRLAEAIVEQLPDLSKPIPVREIAAAIDIYEIREEMLDGLEGGLIVPEDKSEGAILVHKDRPETRKRYTIAHEIGHYVNPWHKSDSPEGFRCRPKDMAVERFAPNDPAAKMEVQANQFAAELLMPKAQVDQFLRGLAGADIAHVIRMADNRFNVSREAAARRYVERHPEPVAVVFSKDGVIRYAKPSGDFPKLAVWGGDKLPSESQSANSQAAVGSVTDWAEVRGHAWLSRSAGVTLFEQTLAQQNGFRMTLLTVEQEEVDADVEERWKPPSFHRQR